MTLTCGVVVVELRGFEPLTPCMPCHPHQFTRPFAALLGTTSALLGQGAGRGAVVRREAARGIVADNLLTEPTAFAPEWTMIEAQAGRASAAASGCGCGGGRLGTPTT